MAHEGGVTLPPTCRIRVPDSRGVAQPGSAPQWGCGGREFESRRPDQIWTMNFPGRFRRLSLLVLAVALLLSCSEAEDPLALFKAGRYHQAHGRLQLLANQGSREAQYALATQYYLGLGTRRNLPEAARWYEEAALSGNAPAQVSLGILYLNGWGMKRDHAKAFGWFQAAADAGNPRALHYLAVITDKLTPNQMTVSRDQVRARLRQSRAR